MPRFEIVAHVVRELDVETAEEAAAAIRRKVLSEAMPADRLMHLAVWRQDPPPADSPLPSSTRQQLTEFFVALERCAAEAEELFRGRVEALLMAETPVEPEPSKGSPEIIA